MKRLIFRRALLCIMTIALMVCYIPLNAVLADATVYYVSPTGDDSNPGTLALPFKTVNKGMTSLTAGDTLYIREGTYNERIDIYDKNGSPTAWFTVKNYPGETATLDGQDSLDKQVGMNLHDCSYFRIEGLQFTRYVGAGIYLENVNSTFHHIEMIGLTMWDFDYPEYTPYGTEAILAGGTSSYCTIRNCHIFNVGLDGDWAKDHGIYIGYGSDNWTIDSNIIHDNSGAGIHMYGAPSGGTNCTITNNVIYNNHVWGLLMAPNATGNVVYNNTFYGNVQHDVDLRDNCYGNTFKNNIFGSYNSHYNLSFISTDPMLNTFDYNCYWKFDNLVLYRKPMWHHVSFIEWQGYGQEQNGICLDPQYMDTANNDFSLQATSPCINAGILDANVPLYDVLGVTRDSYPDMGAYEYQP